MEPNIIKCSKFYEFKYCHEYDDGYELKGARKSECSGKFNIANAVTCYTCQLPLYCSEKCRIESEQNTYEKIYGQIIEILPGKRVEKITFNAGHPNDECQKAFHAKRLPGFKMELFDIFNERHLINMLYEYHTQWLEAKVMRALDICNTTE